MATRSINVRGADLSNLGNLTMSSPAISVGTNAQVSPTGVSIGYSARGSTYGSSAGNIAIGSYSGKQTAFTANTYNNVVIGTNAGEALDGGSHNVAVGFNAGYALTNANNTTSVGRSASASTTFAVALGYHAIANTGTSAIAIGGDSLAQHQEAIVLGYTMQSRAAFETSYPGGRLTMSRDNTGDYNTTPFTFSYPVQTAGEIVQVDATVSGLRGTNHVLVAAQSYMFYHDGTATLGTVVGTLTTHDPQATGDTVTITSGAGTNTIVVTYTAAATADTTVNVMLRVYTTNIA